MWQVVRNSVAVEPSKNRRGGQMNYPLYVGLIAKLAGSPPVIAEHLGSEEFAEARRRLLPLFVKAAQD